MAPLIAAFRVYLAPRMLAILAMGFASGLPLALTGATLAIWMRQEGVSLTAIGLFALVGLSYNLKFLWAPIIDRAPLPWLTWRLGRRRSWTLAIQAALLLAILALAQTEPSAAPLWTALAAVVVAFLSASQDIVIDAYRVELLAGQEQGAGAAATQVGYRVGMIASGAGALYLAEYLGWRSAYMAMAGLMVPAMIVVWLTPEPGRGDPPARHHAGIAAWAKEAFVDPLVDFLGRPLWAALLAFVVLYKFGDALAGVMSSPFYVDMGFTRIEIANVSKIFGVLATIAGVIAGGAVVYRLGAFRALLVCGVLQMLSNVMFAIQATVGHSVPMLVATIGIENFTGGLGSAAFVAYLSGLCSLRYTATQYALLSALAAVGRTTLASAGGALAEATGWVAFFLLTTLAAVPGLILLLWLMRRLPPSAPAADPDQSVVD